VTFQSPSESWVLRRSGAIAYRDAPFDARRPSPANRRMLGMAAAALLMMGFAANAVPPSSGRPAASGADLRPEQARLTSLSEDATYISFPRTPGPAALQARLNKLAADFREPVGVAVTDVTAGWVASVDAIDIYPQQSVSKLWVALTVFDQIDQGRLHLADQVTLDDSDRSVFYQPLARKIGKDGYVTTVEDLLHRQLEESDNAANDRLIKAVGGIDVVTATIAAKGLAAISVGETERVLQARTAGMVWKPEYGRGNNFKEARALLPDAVRDVALANYLRAPGDGASPMGITTALSALRRGKLLSPSSTQTMIGIMEQATTGRGRLKGALPEGWTLAHKTGTGPDWTTGSVGINDVGLITAPDGHVYAVAVMMRETRHTLSARMSFMQNVTRAITATWGAEHQQPIARTQVAAAATGHSGAAD
jgi:beta-lactamase class A